MERNPARGRPRETTLAEWLRCIGDVPVSHSEKAVLWAALMWADNATGVLYPALSSWATAAGLSSRRSLRRIVNDLTTRGFIVPVTDRHGGRRRETTRWRLMFDAMLDAGLEPIAENRQPQTGDSASPVPSAPTGDTGSPVTIMQTGDNRSSTGDRGARTGDNGSLTGDSGSPKHSQLTSPSEHHPVNIPGAAACAAARAREGRIERFFKVMAYAKSRVVYHGSTARPQERVERRAKLRRNIDLVLRVWPNGDTDLPDDDLFHSNPWAAFCRLAHAAAAKKP